MKYWWESTIIILPVAGYYPTACYSLESRKFSDIRPERMPWFRYITMTMLSACISYHRVAGLSSTTVYFIMINIEIIVSYCIADILLSHEIIVRRRKWFADRYYDTAVSRRLLRMITLRESHVRAYRGAAEACHFDASAVRQYFTEGSHLYEDDKCNAYARANIRHAGFMMIIAINSRKAWLLLNRH